MTWSRRTVRLLGLASVVTVWWVWSVRAESLYFPPLPSVLVAFRKNWLFGRLGQDVLPSLEHMALGFLLAAVLGVGAGLLLGTLPTLHRALHPVLEFLRAMPPPVFLSLGLLFLGTGSSMRVAVVALGPLWPILLNTVDGVRSTDPARLDMARVFGLSRLGVLAHVVLPSAAPRILAGLRVGLPLALVLMVISELIGSTEGIGYFISQSSTTYAIADMWSGILLLGLIGWALAALMRVVEGRVLRGYEGAAKPAPTTSSNRSLRKAAARKEPAHV